MKAAAWQQVERSDINQKQQGTEKKQNICKQTKPVKKNRTHVEKLHGSLNSPACSCVSITLPASS